MELLTDTSVSATAASRWKKQYLRDGVWYAPLSSGASSELIHERLVNLGDRPHPDDVTAIVGNASWSSAPPCDECGMSPGAVVSVGQEPDYESATACMCLRCLSKAISLLVEDK
jgi:hypothetical protein